MSHIELVDTLPPDATATLESTLRDFNRDRNPDFWNARELPANAARPLNICARSVDGDAVGALTGETQFKWLRVSLMSIKPSAQRQGIGTRMMQLAESEATRRECQFAYVDTMDYQAPDFYLRLGYTIAGQLDDWDSHGHAKLFFVKRLSASPPEHS